MIGECNGCGREFASLTAFDAHQVWDYAQPPGKQLSCYNPASLLDRDGEPRFRPDARGRWRSARQMPSGVFAVAPQSDEQGSGVPRVTPAPANAGEAR